MFSILILTKNEESNLPSCLESVAWCEDVVVLDSGSDDGTCDIANEFGARVVERKFDNFAAQRNHALDNVEFNYPWVFHLDADERFNVELRDECHRVIEESRFSAFLVPNRIMFLDKWIKYSSQYPYPQVRLLKIGEVRFEKSGHGQREADAVNGIGSIEIPYDHFNFSKGISDWVNKHNHYSKDEAEARLVGGPITFSLRTLLSRKGIERKRYLKKVQEQLPGSWVVKFLYV